MTTRHAALLALFVLLVACRAPAPRDTMATSAPTTNAATATPLPAPTTVATALPPPTTTPPATGASPSPGAAAAPATPTSAIPTPSPTAEALTFAAVGDYGWSGPGAREVAALVAQRDPDIVITLGDNNYPDGAAWTIEENVTANYGRFVQDGRFFPALGNHDMTTDDGQAYFDYFDLPGNERYYDFVRGDAHFFVINSDWREPDGIRADSRQARWLQEGLAASTAPWQIVYFHASPFVSLAIYQVPVMDWPFATWGADLVLSAHAHLYERLDVDGLTYIVNGLGGHTIYPFDDIPHPDSQARYNADFGALFARVTADAIQLQFVTRQGETVDEWTITSP